MNIAVSFSPRSVAFAAAALRVFVFSAIFSAPAFALSTVQLKNGSSLRGDILAEKADRVVVDLGFTVVTVPRDEIEKVSAEAAAPATSADADERDLFHAAANPPVLSMKENVDHVGEAVVQIRTPIGLGSGFFIQSSGYIITNEHVVAGEYN